MQTTPIRVKKLSQMVLKYNEQLKFFTKYVKNNKQSKWQNITVILTNKRTLVINTKQKTQIV